MFNKGDLVDVKERKLRAYGEVIETQGDEAVVHFCEPRHPDKCAGCGFSHGLSMNGGTGEIVCMISGCGYEHGFEERDEIIKLEKLINITAQRKAKEKKEFLSKKKSQIHAIKHDLDEAAKDGLITNEEKSNLVSSLRKEE